MLLHGLRRLGLVGTAHAKAQSATFRVRLSKIGARIRITARNRCSDWSALRSDQSMRITGSAMRAKVTRHKAA
jgi:hypothetical protein